MPVACVYGWDPSLILTAGSPVTIMDEWDWMGAIRGEPVPLIKCETLDLEVPATAEMVIEGLISPDPATYRQEGPLKEVTGGYAEPSLMPVMETTCITYRDDPVMVRFKRSAGRCLPAKARPYYSKPLKGMSRLGASGFLSAALILTVKLHSC